MANCVTNKLIVKRVVIVKLKKKIFNSKVLKELDTVAKGRINRIIEELNKPKYKR